MYIQKVWVAGAGKEIRGAKPAFPYHSAVSLSQTVTSEGKTGGEDYLGDVLRFLKLLSSLNSSICAARLKPTFRLKLHRKNPAL